MLLASVSAVGVGTHVLEIHQNDDGRLRTERVGNAGGTVATLVPDVSISVPLDDWPRARTRVRSRPLEDQERNWRRITGAVADVVSQFQSNGNRGA